MCSVGILGWEAVPESLSAVLERSKSVGTNSYTECLCYAVSEETRIQLFVNHEGITKGKGNWEVKGIQRAV